MKAVIPNWLKTDPFAVHVPDKTIFEPQRRITYRNAKPYLLDCLDHAYPLAQCDRLCLDHLKGIALLVTEDEPITITLTGKHRLELTNGRIKKSVLLPRPDDAAIAAQALAQAFSGAVFTKEVLWDAAT